MTSRSVYSICSPIQLLAAVCVRLEQKQESRCAPADLVIAPKFPGASELVIDEGLKSTFDRIAIYDPFDGNYFPQVKDYFDYKRNPEAHRQRFVDAWPFDSAVYTEFYCGDPHMIIGPKLYLSATGAATYLFDEGVGTYTGTVASFFCINQKTALAKCAKRGKRALAKELIKRASLMSRKAKGYFIRPDRMFVFNPACYRVGTYGETASPRRIAVPTPDELKDACRYFDSKDTERANIGGIYLGTWFQVATEESQRSIIECIAKACDGDLLVRPHPRFPFTAPFDCENVSFDSTGTVWEMACLLGYVTSSSVLFGCCSTTQTTPKFLTGAEPTIVILDAILNPAGNHDVANAFYTMLQGFYSESERVLFPTNHEVLLRELLELYGER